MTDELVRESPLLREGDRVGEALTALLESGMPSLPVVDGSGRYVGSFGERDFIGALFPGYLDALPGAKFVRRSLDDALEHRATCFAEPVSQHMSTDEITVPVEHSAAQVAETFLHHRTSSVPVVDAERRPVGLILRRDFMRRMAQRD